MAGYDGYSRSNNAIMAEDEGKYPASKFAAKVKKYKKYRGCTATDVKAALEPDEWHHTSCKYNRTDFYAITDLGWHKYREKLENEIKTRKEFTKLAKLAKKVGLTHVMTSTGEKWYPIPEKWGGRFGANRSTVEHLREQLN